jgi:hypothetical protein
MSQVPAAMWDRLAKGGRDGGAPRRPVVTAALLHCLSIVRGSQWSSLATTPSPAFRRRFAASRQPLGGEV